MVKKDGIGVIVRVATNIKRNILDNSRITDYWIYSRVVTTAPQLVDSIIWNSTTWINTV